MPGYWATPHALKDRGDIYPRGHLFSYFDGEVITTYMVEQEIESIKKNVSPKYLDEVFYKKYVEKFEDEQKTWWDFIRSIEHKDYENIENEILAKDYQHYTLYLRDAIAYFGSTRPEFTYAAEQELERIIQDHFDKQWDEVFGLITTPIELDDIQKEEVAWEKVGNDNHSRQTLQKHLSRYPWLVVGQFDQEKAFQYLEKIAPSREKNIEARLMQEKEELKKEQEAIFSQLDSEKAYYFANYLQEQAVRRMDIKAYWAGSYYLARNMYHALAKRMSVPLLDGLQFITPPEIQEVLARKKDVGTLGDIILERKKSLSLIYEGGEEIYIHAGEEASKDLGYCIQADDRELKEIMGQTASTGNYKGVVRKVLAGDLDMLQKSIEEFQEGEVLVTSMTQPNMMPIARKAGAIIADEGGITSHAAIISRELKIPCIVGCHVAMDQLENGDIVTVDGAKQKVIIQKHGKA